MSLIPFPNVPNLPGVPQLPRLPGLGSSVPPILVAAAAVGALWRSVLSTPQWGIFKQTPEPAPDAQGVTTVTVVSKLTPIITPDSIQDFGYRNEYEISDYFVQDGSFASYNKVANPNETYVRMTKGGSQSDRAEFLQQIEDILATTDLYTVMTPEKAYLNQNPYRFEMTRRGVNGAYFLTEVDLYFREIRSAVAQYTTTAQGTQNAQDPSAQPVQNDGTVNGDTPANPPDVSDVVTQQ